MGLTKIRAIEHWEELRTIHEVRCSLDLANYYIGFVKVSLKFQHHLVICRRRTKHGIGWRSARQHLAN